MSTYLNSDNGNDTTQGFYTPDEDSIQLLRNILQTETGNPVGFDEAEEIGLQLVSLYECLARKRTISIEATDNDN